MVPRLVRLPLLLSLLGFFLWLIAPIPKTAHATQSSSEATDVGHSIPLPRTAAQGPNESIASLEYVGNIGGGVGTVAISGTLAYIGEGAIFKILDVTDPALPRQLGQFRTPGQIQDIQIVGNLAYVGDDYYGLLVLDITDPQNPVKVSSFATRGQAYDVLIDGPRAYIGDGPDGGLYILDISTPANPVFLGRYGESAYDIDVVNNRAYIASGHGAMVIVDVTNPANPVKLNDTRYLSNATAATGVTVVGNYAYVASVSAGLVIFNVANPLDIRRVGQYDPPHSLKDVFVVGDQVYVTSFQGVLDIVDVYEPWRPYLLNRYDSPGDSADVRVVGDFAYIADGSAGLQILDVRDFSPVLIGAFKTWVASDVVVEGERAYIRSGGSIQIVDVQDPMDPDHIGVYVPSNYANDLQAVGNLLYLPITADWNGSASVNGGLEIVDVSVPTQPTLIGRYTASYARDVFVVGDVAYLVVEDGLHILDVHVPTNPTLIGKFSRPIGLADVYVVANKAYIVSDIGSSLSKLLIIDLQVPVNPVLLGSYDLFRPRNIHVEGTTAFVISSSKLTILDVANPANIRQITTYGRLYVSNMYFAFANGLAYLSTNYDEGNYGELDIVDVSVPTNPRSLTRYSLAHQSYPVALANGLVYVPVSDAGLHILRPSTAPIPTATATATTTPTITGTRTPEPTRTPSATHTITVTGTHTPEPTHTATASPTITGTALPTASSGSTATSTATPIASSTATATASPTSVVALTTLPTASSTAMPTLTASPTAATTETGTVGPSEPTLTPVGNAPTATFTVTASTTPVPTANLPAVPAQTSVPTTVATPTNKPNTTPQRIYLPLVIR